MSQIVMTESANAAVPTPATGKKALFPSTDEGGWAEKDDTGAVTGLQGADGVLTDFDAGTSGAAYEFDLVDGYVQYLELDDDAAITFTGWPDPGYGVLRVWFTQPGAGGPFVPAFGAEVDWGEAGEPVWSTTAGMTDVVDFQSRDGGTVVLATVAGRQGPPGPAVTEILDLPTAETDDSLVLAPDGVGGVEWRAETGGGGGSLTSVEALLGADVSIVTNGTWYDGPSLGSLAAGTWLVTWQALFVQGAVGTMGAFVRITENGTTIFGAGETAGGSNGYRYNLSGTCLFTLGGSTVVKMQVTRSNDTAATLSRYGGQGSPYTTTRIVGVKVA